MPTRRNFIKSSSLAALAAGGAFPEIARAADFLSTPVDTVPRSGDPQLRVLAMRALDAATSAGASYADVRLTVTRTQEFVYGNPPVDTEHIAVGVRALVNGVWGFVASPEWTLDVMDQSGKAAAAQAKANAWPNVPPVELGERPPVATGTWSPPIKRDPFTVAVNEKLDFIRAAEGYADSFRNGGATSVIVFQRQERTFASTDGSFVTQTLYNTLGNGSYFFVSANDRAANRYGLRYAQFVGPSAAGYEIFEDVKFFDLIPQLYEEAKELWKAEPVNPSRYDIVFDGYAMTKIVDQSIGAALELDRALGLEANAGGTSYLAPISDILGKPLSTSLLNVSGNRTDPTGAASVRWDDDGVAAGEFPLITSGTVVDYATSREHAGALSEWYRGKGMPLQSHGCANSGNGMDFPLIHTPNLRLHPSTKDTSFAELVSEVDDGLAVLGSSCSMDHQKLTGQGVGELVYRIRNGKLAEPVNGAAFLFRSPDLWKNLTGVGGASTVVKRGVTVKKGQPEQQTAHTVETPAVRFKNMSVINIRAKYQAMPRTPGGR